MSALLVLNKIRQHFPGIVENVDMTHLQNYDNLQHYLSLLACQIPSMSCAMMHKICERQEKTVISKIQEIQDLDIYEEIALIVPSLKLKHLSMEEVSKKISHLKPESKAQMDTEEDSEDEMCNQLNFDIRSRRSQYERHQLKNILQEEEHGHPWWNDNKLFQFN